MPGAWKKTLSYLGLVEEEEDVEDLHDDPALYADEPQQHHRFGRSPDSVAVAPAPETVGGVVRTIPQPRPHPATTIHKAEPKRFNEARDLGDKFREGIPVIMNLQGTDDPIARRLVDFASGLVFGLGGKIEMAANRVYLLTPADVEVSAEERQRLSGSFYNQF
ncbi:MAG TPA: cell division protein SepF [Actinomycetota bacterium]|nr:cell division protein SepF [Actinomycetota bacterium]